MTIVVFIDSKTGKLDSLALFCSIDVRILIEKVNRSTKRKIQISNVITEQAKKDLKKIGLISGNKIRLV